MVAAPGAGLARARAVDLAIRDYDVFEAAEYAELLVDLANINANYDVLAASAYAAAMHTFAVNTPSPWADQEDLVASLDSVCILAESNARAAEEITTANARRDAEIGAADAQQILADDAALVAANFNSAVADAELTRVVVVAAFNSLFPLLAGVPGPGSLPEPGMQGTPSVEGPPEFTALASLSGSPEEFPSNKSPTNSALWCHDSAVYYIPTDVFALWDDSEVDFDLLDNLLEAIENEEDPDLPSTPKGINTDTLMGVANTLTSKLFDCSTIGTWFSAVSSALDATAQFGPQHVHTHLCEVCFAAGTPVGMADGTEKAVEELVPGDLVVADSGDEPDGRRDAKEVVRVFHNPPQPVLSVRHAKSDEPIRSTPGHRFYVEERGWTAAEDLRAGDLLHTLDSGRSEVISVSAPSEPVPVFNIEVRDHHTYFVGPRASAVLVHNACECGTSQAPATGQPPAATSTPPIREVVWTHPLSICFVDQDNGEDERYTKWASIGLYWRSEEHLRIDRPKSQVTVPWDVVHDMILQLNRKLKNAKVHEIVIAGHGSPTSCGGIRMSELKRPGSPAYRLIEYLGTQIAEGGHIRLNSCHAAADGPPYRFMQEIAKIAGVPVVGFTGHYSIVGTGIKVTVYPDGRPPLEEDTGWRYNPATELPYRGGNELPYRPELNNSSRRKGKTPIEGIHYHGGRRPTGWGAGRML